MYILEFMCSQCQKTYTMAALDDHEKEQLTTLEQKSECCNAKLIFIKAFDISHLMADQCCGGSCCDEVSGS